MTDLSERAQDLHNYIKRGTDDDFLMQKYGTCYEGLETLFHDLVQAGSYEPADEPDL